MQNKLRYLYLVGGWTAFFLGLVGAFLPILPTTPFMILAAFCFSKGSKQCHDWLLSRPVIGRNIADWERFGVIRTKSKCLATLMIVVLFSYTLIFVPVAIVLKFVISAIGLAVLIFIWTRPSLPRDTTPPLPAVGDDTRA